MKYTLAISIVLWISLPSCEDPKNKLFESDVGVHNPWTHLNFNNDTDNFQFAVVGDRTGDLRPGVFRTAVKKLNLLQPEFVISVGDLIVGWDEERNELIKDTVKINARWDRFNEIISELQPPFFYVGGNNDLLNPVLEKQWIERYRETYYSFSYKDVLFVILNSDDTQEENTPNISSNQINWIKSTINSNQDRRWIMVFLHRPLWVDVPDQWMVIKEILKNQKHTVFAGHHHTYRKVQNQDATYYQLGTTGGGSDLSGAINGRFDHVSWVTMTDVGPVISNLMLDGIWSDDPIKEVVGEFEFTTTYQSFGLESTVKKLKKLEKLNPDKDYFGSHQMNLLVRQLIIENNGEDALVIAEINSNQYPELIQPTWWLAEAHLANNDTCKAINLLKKIRHTNPDYTQANQRLIELQNSPLIQ